MNFYFHDPRFKMTAGGEFLVRLTTYSVYAFLIAAVPFLIFSEANQMRFLGIILTLFLIDRLFHIKKGEKSIINNKGENINIALSLANSSYGYLSRAMRRALALQGDFYLFLMDELSERREVKEILRRLDIPPQTFRSKLQSFLENPAAESKKNKEEILAEMEKAVLTAYLNAVRTNERFIEPRNLFVGLVQVEDVFIPRLLDFFGITAGDLSKAVIFGRWRETFAGMKRMPAALGGFARLPGFARTRTMNRAWTARPTPTLDEFSVDLTTLARKEKVGFLVGHEKEYEEMIRIISRPGKPNVLLVGEAGTGKTAIVGHLAFNMVKDRVPPVLFDKRLIELSVPNLVSGASPEVLGERLKKITEEIILAGNIVIVMPYIHDLFKTGEGGAQSAIDILMPVIRSGAIPIIGETYPREFKKFVEERSDFMEYFETVKVEELTVNDAIYFLVYMSLVFERQFKIFITFKAVKSAVVIAKRYFADKPLPGSAVELLKQSLVSAAAEGQKILDEAAVIKVAEQRSQVPIAQVGEVEAEKLLNLEELIHERLINQEAAASAVARALREYRSGLTRKGGPIATFLFVGPTGVGKTELAKILAKVHFGSADSMVRLDMSEYQDKASVSRFLGSAEGERRGTLTEAVREKPYTLVLLDEFEKAHPDILNLFLAVFDDGRLTDSFGRTVDFKNAIIIATSNAHSEFIKKEVESGKTIEEISDELKRKLTDYFKPELINRFSDIIVFRNLNLDEIHKVAKLLVGEVQKTLRENHGAILNVSEPALRKISELGFSPVFGARPLRQVISREIRSALADKILRREISRGDELTLNYEDDEFKFGVK